MSHTTPPLSSEPPAPGNSPYNIQIEVDDPYAAQVDVDNLATAVETTLRRQGVVTGQVTVVITDDKTVRTLNREHLGIDEPTDVLSFAAREPGDPIVPSLALPPELEAEMANYLGDIIIAYPYAERQAAHYGASIAAELRLLVVHGTLHLLGYDHHTPTAEAAMWTLQEAVLAEFGDSGLAARRYDEHADEQD
jgi:probable rRNA maturation factor